MSNPSSMETQFEEVSDGYIINGSKNWITNAPIAVFYRILLAGNLFTLVSIKQDME